MTKPLTEPEAQEMLARLSRHYGQPVLPVQRYCEALETWRDCIEAAYREDGSQGDSRFSEVARASEAISLAIRKSCLLDRLIYRGEKLRTKRCPVHDGRWHGIATYDHDCEHGCDLTGWIPDDFVPVQPGEPCRHKFRWVSGGPTRQTTCAVCKEVLDEKLSVRLTFVIYGKETEWRASLSKTLAQVVFEARDALGITQQVTVETGQLTGKVIHGLDALLKDCGFVDGTKLYLTPWGPEL